MSKEATIRWLLVIAPLLRGTLKSTLDKKGAAKGDRKMRIKINEDYNKRE